MLSCTSILDVFLVLKPFIIFSKTHAIFISIINITNSIVSFADQMQKRNELTVKSKIDIEESQIEVCVCALNIDE